MAAWQRLAGADHAIVDERNPRENENKARRRSKAFIIILLNNYRACESELLNVANKAKKEKKEYNTENI